MQIKVVSGLPLGAITPNFVLFMASTSLTFVLVFFTATAAGFICRTALLLFHSLLLKWNDLIEIHKASLGNFVLIKIRMKTEELK